MKVYPKTSDQCRLPALIFCGLVISFVSFTLGQLYAHKKGLSPSSNRNIVTEVPESRAKQVAQVKPWPRIVLLGDSLTQLGYGRDGSWVARLSNDYVMLADVINRGFGGYNTNMFRQILEQLISQDLFTNVRAVTLFLGANDAQWHRHQSLPLEEYKVNLRYIINRLTSGGYVRLDQILLVPTPPVNSVVRRLPIEHTYKYYLAGLEVAKEMNCATVELWDPMNYTSKFVPDGIHFSEEGSITMYGLLGPKIRNIVGRLRSQVTFFKRMKNIELPPQ